MDYKKLNEEGRQLWDSKAAYWDDLHGVDGNDFHRTLVSPSVERLLNLQPGERVLDIGCGTGVLARRLAILGGEVVATDFSSELLKQAQTYETASPIDYRLIDATDEAALRALGDGRFDAITCTMALMDMPQIVPLYRAVRHLLAEGGRFVFAQSHPAFNSSHPMFVLEQGDDNGRIVTTHSVKISRYLKIPPVLGAGTADEPNPHYYYHRSLQQLLGDAFTAGLVMDGLEEMAYPEREIGYREGISWRTLWQIPAVLTCRLRVAHSSPD